MVRCENCAQCITGTEVAKEAADIIILDDNFMSIVKAVLWGRNTFNNIRKFLQFQLTVNFASLILVFIGTITVGNFPLKVLQLLWVRVLIHSECSSVSIVHNHDTCCPFFYRSTW